MQIQDTALILEGGGMRGMFSAGVLEALMLKKMVFPYIAAVSAGACSVLSYMSHQPLRTRRIIENYITDQRYFSFKNWMEKAVFSVLILFLKTCRETFCLLILQHTTIIPVRCRSAPLIAAADRLYGLAKKPSATNLCLCVLLHRCRF